MKTQHRFKIPQMMYLRKYIIKSRGPGGVTFVRTIHIYWNYRNNNKGIVDTGSRGVAKLRILDKYPEAEFFR